jgi:hypothetical protein
MNEEKIENRLREEMRRAEKAGEGSRQIPVLIEHETAAIAGPGGMQALQESVRASQQGIRRKLEELGAAESVRVLALANAVEAMLTPAGISEIAALREVKKILWNRAERVTALSGSI